MKSSNFYTVKNTIVKAVALRLASRLLTLPNGSWAETQEAESQLRDAMPSELSVEDMLQFAAQHCAHIHPSRMEWLRNLGRRYSVADQAKVYPALAKYSPAHQPNQK
jgi:hypothetical protein